MEKNNIVVLINLDKPQPNIILNSINIARSMNATVTFLYVKKGTDVVKNENHISAVKTLTSTHMKIDRKMRELLDPFHQSTDTEIRSKIAIGNVKNHIKQHLESLNPDLVILGKRSKKTLPWDGDRLTQFVVNSYLCWSPLLQVMQGKQRSCVGSPGAESCAFSGFQGVWSESDGRHFENVKIRVKFYERHRSFPRI